MHDPSCRSTYDQCSSAENRNSSGVASSAECIFVRCVSSAALTIQKSSPSWTIRNVPVGLVFSTSGLFSSPAAVVAAAAGEPFASDSVCAISCDSLFQPQSAATRLSSSSMFIDGEEKNDRMLSKRSRSRNVNPIGLQESPDV